MSHRLSPAAVASRATHHLHNFGRGDHVRPGQAETYMAYLLADLMTDRWLARLQRRGVPLDRVAGAVERSGARADVDNEFYSWALNEGFKRSHVWLRGYVATALAIRDLKARVTV